MNVYEMYEENGYKFGYWIVRNTWGNSFAKVLSIKGTREGQPIKGRPPYYNNPTVYVAFYHHGVFKENMELRCPGTYSYSMIPPEYIEEIDKENNSIT